MKPLIGLVLGVSLLGAGCGPAAEAEATPQSAPPAGPTGEPSTPMSTLPQNDPLAQVAELARADLASRLQIDPALIEVVVAERVTWPDGSLGCPQPGRFYTQALVEGFRVVLGTGGRTRVYVYHAGSDGAAFLCPSSAADGGHDFVPPPGFDT